MNNYLNIQAGAIGLLFDSCTILNRLNANYIIVGGWSPFLLNSTEIIHPGTKDVDVLFDKAYIHHTLKPILLEFLNNEYILSAKHDFQLFKKFFVTEREFIYNVDLLHPLETEKPKDIYVEQIDLEIPADKYQHETFKIKSIALPSSQALIDNKMMVMYDLLHPTTGEKIEIPLMSELGTLITKSKSISIPKRYRDSLDIYLAIKQNRNYNQLIKDILRLKKDNISTFNTLYGIREAFDEGIITVNIQRFTPVSAENIKETFNKFFNDTTINLEAKS